MKKVLNLTANEESILQTLWEQDRPLSRSEILRLTEDREWKTTSFYGLLNKLLERNLIEVDGIVPTGKNFGRAYVPTVTKKEYDLMKLEQNMESVKPDKDVFFKFVSNLVKSKHLDHADIDELQEILNNKKNK
ncbi:MAG: BlaI/MecI/CopY family transcriptional regulator [Tissierellia bacterium]|nr:BlaI/MecI/CopY family transcriptional regulator [Tissierellia bacterium]